jgi:putative inorganic carbon (hco3(-)) transporter
MDPPALADQAGVQRARAKRNPVRTVAFGSLLLFMVVYFARPGDWIPGLTSIPVAKLVGILAIVTFSLAAVRAQWRLPKEALYLILLLVQLFLTVPFSPVWRGGAFWTTVTFAKVVPIVLAMGFVITTTSQLRRIIFVQTASIAVISAVALYQHRLVFGRLQLEGALSGSYGNPNDLAFAIGLSLPFCLAFLILARSWLRKGFWALALVVMLYVMFLTGSRAGFLVLITAVGACAWEFGIRSRRGFLILALGLVSLLVFVLAGGQVQRRLSATFNDDQGDTEKGSAYGSAQARKDLLKKSIATTIEHPLFGVGPGNFEVISGVWHTMHNSYTQMSAEGGLPALVLYLMIFWRAFANVRGAKKLSRGRTEPQILAAVLRASLLAYLVGSFFASEAYQYFPYFLVGYTTVLFGITRTAHSYDIWKSQTRGKAKIRGDIDGDGQGAEFRPAWVSY